MDADDFQQLKQKNKNNREARFFGFEEEWHEKFEIKFEEDFWYDAKKQCFTILSSCDEFPDRQYFDYYPKSNKVLIRKLNQWKTGGLKFLIKIFNLT